MRTSSSSLVLSGLLFAVLAATSTGCGGDDDGGVDGGTVDGGAVDGGRADGGRDAGTADGAVGDGGAGDARMDDGAAPDDGGPDGGMDDGGGADGGGADGGGACARDEDCAFGAEWCVDGACAPCDDSGTVCDLACTLGWDFPVRHGCTPCRCAPSSACMGPADCGSGLTCVAGEWCFEGCTPAGSPACCRGNLCAGTGCSLPPPVGCRTRGCPAGQECRTDMGCAPSNCGCGAGDPGWICTADCGGGVCATP